MSDAVDPRSPLGREIQARFSAMSVSVGKAQVLAEQTKYLPAAIDRAMNAYDLVSAKLAEVEGPSKVDIESTKQAAMNARQLMQDFLITFQDWTESMDRTIEAGMKLRSRTFLNGQ
jgi:hypothetical protein